MNIFGNPYNRGCFIKKEIDSSKGQGVRLNINGTNLPANDTDPFIIVGFNVNKGETIAIMRCFNNKSFVYAFGDDIEQSLLHVKIMGLNPAQSAGESISHMFNTYTNNTIYKQPSKRVMLTYGGFEALTGYILGMSSATTSAEYGMQSYDLKLLLTMGSDSGRSGGALLGGQRSGGALLGGQQSGGALLNNSRSGSVGFVNRP